jgi:hypothetical protein
MSRQSLKADLRASIWRGVNRSPGWQALSHARRRAIAKQIFWQIWKSTPDKTSLAEGMRWARLDVEQLVKVHLCK